MLLKKIVVFDFETDSPDPHSCNPVQLAAMVINGRTLEIVPNETFCSDMKPEGIDDLEQYTSDKKRMSTVRWHADILNCTTDDVLQRWQDAPAQRHVWSQFSSFVNRFNSKGTRWSAPIAGGMNIKNFDLIITDRLNEKYGIKTMFWPRDKVDLLECFFYWLTDKEGAPSQHKMDVMRPYFGLTSDGAHDALKDVKDCVLLIQKFLRLHRTLAQSIQFEGSCK